ncbi:ATP-grasp domain-containing protein [Xenorhabdus griffiniae]|uniref:ATP-grasp domain-containing protein n=1 Tax=Xenorhabdus griffiniae TaxID=351672 RepID=UPI002359BB20|nr:ATP-grasp domain-containing protein [Xenorhabdus griffiniae]MDC9606772.1 ATP-grasp domain-containing protein [Xenorhabdus griffiniae]
MKKKIALIGGWDSLINLVINLGHELYLYYFDDDSFSDINLKCCNLAMKLSHQNQLEEIISSHCQQYCFDVIYSHKEIYQEKASLLAEKLGVKGGNFHAVHTFRNKFAFRRLLSQLLPKYSTPWMEVNTRAEVKAFLAEAQGSIILKPHDGMGSSNIKEICTENEIEELTTFPLLAEQFIYGDEYSAEFISINRRHYLVGITEKMTSGNPYFFEISHTFPAALSESKQNNIGNVICTMLDLAGYQNGASHTEFKIQNKQVVLIESHTRAGGDKIPILISKITGYDLVKENLNSIVGDVVSLPTKINNQQQMSIIYFFGDGGKLNSIEFLDNIRDKCGDKLFWLKFNYRLGDLLPKTINSFTRYGFAIISKSNKQFMNEIRDFFNINKFLKNKSSKT